MARTEYGTTWWGQKWLEALTGIDWENRIPRGKTYANTGKVLSLTIDPKKHQIKGRVKGNWDPFYKVSIQFPEIPKKKIEELVEKISQSPLLVARLSARELDPDLLEVCNQIGIQLFPKKWSDLGLSCSCPDWAVPCKHLAAVIYKFSQEIDANPFILFSVRGIDLIGSLESRGVPIEKAVEAELPKWSEILGDYSVAKEEGKPQVPNFPALPTLTYQEKQSWLNELNELAFAKIDFEPDQLTDLLPEQPAGYILGNLRDKLKKVIGEGAKAAKRQISNVSLHTAPSISNEDAFICINSWGMALPNETMAWTEFDSIKGCEVPVSIASKRPGNRPVRLHQMFSGYLNRNILSSSPEQVEAFYYFWIIATKLAMAGAVMPQIYEPVPDGFRVRWLPAVSSPAIRELTEKAGRLAEMIDSRYLSILKRPYSMNPLVLGEIVLGMFIQSYMEEAFEENPKFASSTTPEDLALFAGKYIDCEDDSEAEAAKLRLAAWLTPLAKGSETRRKIRPMLTVHDHYMEGERAETVAEAFDSPIRIEFGFVLEDATGMESREEKLYVPLDDIISKPEWKSIRFEALKTVAQLSGYCPELVDLLRNSSARKNLTMEKLTPLMFKALPSLKLLGTDVILPRGLQKLLTPEVSMELDLPDEWEEGMGFMSLANLLDFNWRVAVGDQAITKKEFQALCKQAGSIVRFHNRYVFVDDKQIASINRKLVSQNAGINPMGLMRAALSGELDKKTGVILSDKLKDALANMFSEKEVPLPEDLHADLRPYQQRGFNWMMRNIRIGLGSILADDMGLGKTLQVLTVLEKMREEGELDEKPALIVVPTTLLTNWVREAEKFTPQLRLGVYYGAARNTEFEGFHGILTTYGTLRSSISQLNKKEFRLLIIDEAQAIKNHKTSTAKAVRSVKKKSFIAMSGTPVENRLMEYWSIMEAANPGVLGTATHFQKDVAKPIENLHDVEAAEKFKRVTAPFIMRRMKTDKSIISDLPDKISTDEFCTLTKEQAALYKKTVDSVMKKIEDKADQFERQAMVLQLILQLKQICNSPAQFEPKSVFNKPEDSGKMLRTFEIIDEVLEADRKILVFTQFKQMGEILQRWIGEHLGKKPDFIHGGLSVKARQEMVDKFQNDRSSKVLILSLKAAGTGLNLTAASAIIHYDLWWNPAVEAQATDRAYRIGQERAVNVYRLICSNTFEEKINAMIEAKKNLAEMTVSTGENWIGDLSDSELKEIFTLS